MKEIKDPAKLVDEMKRLQDEQIAKGSERFGPCAIGRHVLALLERGEPLSVDTLRQSLAIEADAASVPEMDRTLARWAVKRIDAIT